MTVRACDSTTTISALYDRISPAVEDTLVDTLKTVARTIPAPRNDPFYGLDRPGVALKTLERMTAHGDFRKYVFVLDAGGGLGGIARWLTLTYGCRVLVLDVLPRLLATAQRLTRRAGLANRVGALAGCFEAIPVRDGAFTQIWSVEALHHARDRRRALGELFRVLRPGCTLALHEVVRRSPVVPEMGGCWRHGTEEEYRELLAATGFSTIESADVTAERAEPSAITRSVEETFLRLLGERDPAAAADWRRGIDRLRAADAIVRDRDYRSVQLFARRPSV